MLLSVAIALAPGSLSEVLDECLRRARTRVVFARAPSFPLAAFLLELQRANPNVVFIDLTSPDFEELISQIRGVCSAEVIVVNLTAPPDSIIAAMRAGASDFVTPPVEQSLAAALRRVESRRLQCGNPDSRCLGILSAQGGSGGTTVACHLAAALQRVTEKSILLADLDFGAGDVGFRMEVTGPYTILDAVNNAQRLDFSYWKGLVGNCGPRLDVIPAPRGLVTADSFDHDAVRGVIGFLKSIYDWLIVDLGRGPNVVTLSLLPEMQEILLVTTPELPALHRTKCLVQELEREGFGAARLHIVLTKTPRSSEFSADELQRVLGADICCQLPNQFADLHRAYTERKLVAPDSVLGKQFTHFARKVAGIPDEGDRSHRSLFRRAAALGWGRA